MKKNSLHKAVFILSKQFKLIWSILTLFALALILLITFQISYEHSYKDVVEITKDLSKNLDGVIEDLFQEVYTLPIYGKNIVPCPTELKDNLKHIVFNNPNISGLIIRDKAHRTVCATNSLSTTVQAVSNNRARTLLGPFVLSLFDQPIFFIRQKIGIYYIDIELVASILKNNIETSNSLANSVVLYDDWDKKPLIKIQHSNDKWVFSSDSSAAELDEVVVTDKLHSIDGVVLKVFANKDTVNHQILVNEFLATLLTLIISYIFYLLINHNINSHYSLKRAIKIGIKEKQFYPEYQPLFDHKENRFCGVELLARWQEYEGNVIMPDFFIDEAESTGLIVPITLQIIEIAFREFQEFLKEYPNFHLGINLTVDHFQDPFFFNQFYSLKTQYGVSAQQIVFEITERHLLDTNNKHFIKKMNQLREADFSLAIDDYGTGHASISYLQSFPFNYLKIDKLFIQAIGTKAITESLNDAIIHMAKDLNLAIIAEGVETQEQVDYLVRNDVRYLQGWYYSKAVSIDKIKELIQGKKNEFTN